MFWNPWKPKEEEGQKVEEKPTPAADSACPFTGKTAAKLEEKSKDD
jgi:hypothetical protein